MDEKKEDGSCGKGCGLHCGCCVCKAIKGVLLLLLGGTIGFFIGRGCGGGRRMCPVSDAAMTHAQSAPTPAATPAPKKTK